MRNMYDIRNIFPVVANWTGNGNRLQPSILHYSAQKEYTNIKMFVVGGFWLFFS